MLPYGPTDRVLCWLCLRCAGGPWQIAPTTFFACSSSTPGRFRGESFVEGWPGWLPPPWKYLLIIIEGTKRTSMQRVWGQSAVGESSEPLSEG